MEKTVFSVKANGKTIYRSGPEPRPFPVVTALDEAALKKIAADVVKSVKAKP